MQRSLLSLWGNPALEFFTSEKFLRAGFYFLLLAMVYFQIFHVRYYLDSDSAGELLYAKEILLSGSLLPKTWYHSTEVYVIGMFSLEAVFLKLFGNLLLAKALANVSALFLLLGSFYFLAKVCRLDKKYIYLGMILLLSPIINTSVYLFLYTGAQYTLYVASIFFGLGVIISIANRETNVLQIIALIIITVAFSIQSPRVLATCLIPMLFASCIIYKKQIRAIIAILFLVIISILGTIIAKRFLYSHLHTSGVVPLGLHLAPHTIWMNFRLTMLVAADTLKIIPKIDSFSSETVFTLFAFVFLVLFVIAVKKILFSKKSFWSHRFLVWFNVIAFVSTLGLLASININATPRYFTTFCITIPLVVLLLLANNDIYKLSACRKKC